MSQPYLGEIRLFAGNFAPAGWAFCAGQLVAISDYDTLFNLIGTTYGGDGQSTFALPDLQGRIPLHFGQGLGLNNYVLGETGGVEQVTLTTSQIPAHTHTWPAVVSPPAATNLSPVPGNALAQSTVKTYKPGTGTVNMAADMVQAAGGSQPHNNMMPYVVLNYIISLFGIFPSQT